VVGGKRDQGRQSQEEEGLIKHRIPRKDADDQQKMDLSQSRKGKVEGDSNEKSRVRKGPKPLKKRIGQGRRIACRGRAINRGESPGEEVERPRKRGEGGGRVRD